MKNIVDTVIEVIEENGAVKNSEIKKELKDLKKTMSNEELDASIYSDLLNDGRFIFVDGKWDLKANFTVKDIVKEQYKVIGAGDQFIEENDFVDEETMDLESLVDAIDLEDDVIAIDDIDEIATMSTLESGSDE